MALGEKYNIDLWHKYGASDRVVKIYKEGFSGSVTDLVGGGVPARMVKGGDGDADILDVVVGTELILTIVATSFEQYIEFANTKPLQYFAIVYNNTTAGADFSGWLIPEEYEQPYTQPPHEFTIRFTCGLGILADFDYLNSGAFYTGRDREITILANALAPIQQTVVTSYIYVGIGLIPTGGSTSASNSPLYQAYTDQNKYINEDGTVWSCLDVIKDIVGSYGARIFNGFNGWWVIRTRDHANWIYDRQYPYVRYTYAGVYSSYGGIGTLTLRDITGPNVDGRDDDVFFIGGDQMMRIERPYRQARVRCDLGYKNMIMLPSFADGYDTFWGEGPYYTFDRVTDTDDETKYNMYLGGNLASPKDSINQTFRVSYESVPSQKLIVSCEYLLEGDVDIEQYNLTFRVYLDSDSGATYDRWITGTVGSGGSSLSWTSSGTDFYVYTKATSGSWAKVTFEIPAIPSNGELTLTLYAGDCPPTDTVDNTRIRNVRVIGIYDGYEEMQNIDEVEVTISDDNLSNPEPLALTSGDWDQYGSEAVFWRHTKSLNSTGTTPTTTWRAAYRNGTVMVAVGPAMYLQDYVMHAVVMAHGALIRRINGQININDDRIERVAIQDTIDGVDMLFLWVSMDFDFVRGECMMNLVNLPDYGEIIEDLNDTNLIANWSNSDWTTFVVTSDPLIDHADDSAGGIAYADNISSLIPYEVFRVRVSFTYGDPANPPTLTIGSWSDTITDGYDELVVPRTTAGSNVVILTANASGTDITNCLITVTRVYGY